MNRDVNPQTLLELAEGAARQAGALLLEYYNGRLDVKEKLSARDVVSEADFAAERTIVGILEEQRPQDAIVGEEFGRRGHGELTWGIDPLDGTSNYVAGIPHWAVCIGCEDQEGSLVGVIYDVLRNELFSAARGARTTLNGRAVESSVCSTLETAIGAFGPAWTDEWHEHRVAISDRLLSRVAHARQMGSLAVDLAWTAAGRFDFFYYESELNVWDVAARVIAEEAGLVTELIPRDEARPGALVAAPEVLIDQLRGALELAATRD